MQVCNDEKDLWGQETTDAGAVSNARSVTWPSLLASTRKIDMLASALAILDMLQQTTGGPIFRLRRQGFTSGLNDEAELPRGERRKRHLTSFSPITRRNCPPEALADCRGVHPLLGCDQPPRLGDRRRFSPRDRERFKGIVRGSEIRTEQGRAAQREEDGSRFSQGATVGLAIHRRGRLPAPPIPTWRSRRWVGRGPFAIRENVAECWVGTLSFMSAQ